MIGLVLILAIMIFIAYLAWSDADKKMHSPDTNFTKWLNGDSDRMI